MNKIIVTKNKIDNICDGIEIYNRTIKFIKSGNYYFEYNDCNKINYKFLIDDDISIFLFETSFDNNLNVENRYVVNNGYLVLNKFYSNDIVNENVKIDLNGINSRIDYYFSNICKGEEKYIIDINHNNKKTTSNICNKSIALNNSILNFVINSKVKKGNEKSILNQSTRIVTFGDSNSKISPNMFIDEDDVEAKHGSIIGTFKDNVVFYLMSRGINYKDSLKLLVKGYLFSNLSVDSDIKSKILDIIDRYWR